MEDPHPVEDWSIQEYSSKEQSSKLRWILKKGLNVGKKILVTGFVISTAPLVLPPLVAISIIGFACSVPSGILLASYACTNKLMSKLLPECKSPPFSLEYGTVYNEEEVVNDEIGGGENLGLKGDFYVGEEEQEILDNTRGNVGMRLMGDDHEQGDVRKDEQELMSDVNEIAEENGYQKDVQKYEDKEGEEPAKEIEVIIESVGKKEKKEPVVDGRSDRVPVDEVQAVVVNIAGDEISGRIEEEEASVFQVSNIVVEVCENKEIEEDEELMRETRGLLEGIREEGMTDSREDNKQSLEKQSTGTEEKERKVAREVEPLRESEHKIEENKHGEIPKESAEKQERGHMENVDVVPGEMKPIEPVEGLLRKLNVDSILEAEKSRGEVNGTTDVGTTKEDPSFVDNADADYNDVEDAPAGNKPSLETTGYMELPVSTGKRGRNGTAGISSQKDLGMASSKVLYSEKMWQQINAVRQIVGYKAAKQSTCFEELKALYLFTGVQPQAAFKDPSDLVEINDKLRFLMSIVGVK